MSFDPDFIITIDGEDVTEYVTSWELHDVDSGRSNLVITLERVSSQISPTTKGKVTIKFGYVGDLSELVEMDIRTVEYKFDVGAVEQVRVTAYDCTWGMDSNYISGMGEEDTKQSIEKAVRAIGLNPNTKNIQGAKPSTNGGKPDPKVLQTYELGSIFQNAAAILNTCKIIQ
jgi:hypothetical protein